MALGKRVEELRKARGLTQGRLADMTSGAISQQNLDRLEKRDARTSEAAPALADALGVSLRWLLTGEGAREATDWPFPRVARSRWDALSTEDRAYVQGAINRALDECSASASGEAGADMASPKPSRRTA